MKQVKESEFDWRHGNAYTTIGKCSTVVVGTCASDIGLAVAALPARNTGEIHEVFILRNVSFGTTELRRVRTKYFERTENCRSLLDEMLE